MMAALVTMEATRPDELIHDWNAPDGNPSGEIQFDDETLRDGLQSPSVKDPGLEEKIRLLHLMDALGIDTADVRRPGAAARARARTTTVVRETKARANRTTVACRT